MQRDTTTVVCMVATVAVATALLIWFTRPSPADKPGKRAHAERKYVGGDVALASTPVSGPKRRKTRSVSFSDPLVTTNPADYTEPVKAIHQSLTLRRSKRNQNPFTIEPNSGGGDCLFYCFKRTIDEFEVTTTIKELRGIVAESITDDQFSVLKIIYDGAKQEKEYQVLNDYNFMSGVETIDDLRDVITNTKKYWGDEMAIRALEKASGITAVVITKDMKGNATVADKMDSDIDVDRKWFTLLLLENAHYQTILFKNKAALQKNELDNAIEILNEHAVLN